MNTQSNFDKNIEAILNGEQTELQLPDLDTLVAIEPASTLRDAVRQAFHGYGIDIEFSGKGIHERGVVIDLDSEFLQQKGLDPLVLHFGQTVVRVKA
jgi:GDPmannose 4,6-dehydratase